MTKGQLDLLACGQCGKNHPTDRRCPAVKRKRVNLTEKRQTSRQILADAERKMKANDAYVADMRRQLALEIERADRLQKSVKQGDIAREQAEADAVFLQGEVDNLKHRLKQQKEHYETILSKVAEIHNRKKGE